MTRSYSGAVSPRGEGPGARGADLSIQVKLGSPLWAGRADQPEVPRCPPHVQGAQQGVCVGGPSPGVNPETTAPASRKIKGAVRLTLPPPTAAQRPPRLGVLAAGHAGIAAGAREPEMPGHTQP